MSPSYPSDRRFSIIDTAPSEPPTTTTLDEASGSDELVMGSVQLDGTLGAADQCVLHRVDEPRRRLFVEHDQLVVVVEVKDPRRRRDANAVALTLVVVHVNFEGGHRDASFLVGGVLDAQVEHAAELVGPQRLRLSDHVD